MCAGNLLKDVHPVLRREISAAVKRQLVWCEENIQRPATLHAHQVQGIHVKIINIRAFFPIYFNADKMLVHYLRNGFILKAIMLHHMTPVAG